MKTSESIAKFAPAFLAAQIEMDNASKNATNPAFRSKYANLEGVIDAVKPALNSHGIAFLQTGSPSTPGMLTLTTRLIHSSGEWMEDTAECSLSKNDPQGFGSAMTYLRRYNIASICGITQEDDDGNAASQPSTSFSQSRAQSREPSLVDQVCDALNSMPEQMQDGWGAWMETALNCSNPREMNAEQLGKLWAAINKP